MMAQTDFRRNLRDLIDDVEPISKKQLSVVRDIIKKTGIRSPEAVRDKSAAAAQMLTWVLAIVKYANIAKDVSPIQDAVDRATRNLIKSEKELEAIKQTRKELQVRACAPCAV